AMLQSPQFLYHHEVGANGPTAEGSGFVRFDQYELASRLSYLFWASMPDDELLAAADARALSSPAQLVAQARRLLADPKATEGIDDFHLQWLELVGLEQLAKDPIYASYSVPVAAAMLEETRQFARGVFLGAGADGKLETLLTSTSSFADVGLARIYGLPAPAG